MTTETMAAEVIDADETEAPYCDACGEDIEGEPCDYSTDRLCKGCYDAQVRQDAVDQAEEEVNDADGEVESIAEEVDDLRRKFEAEMAELKERLADAKSHARAARRRLARAEAKAP